ncbi:MAG TPA: J domain-containing protein, partial [Myxococcota bacterium]|nr:J domain-containing protein [Myxococcota bacterium]
DAYGATYRRLPPGLEDIAGLEDAFAIPSLPESPGSMLPDPEDLPQFAEELSDDDVGDSDSDSAWTPDPGASFGARPAPASAALAALERVAPALDRLFGGERGALACLSLADLDAVHDGISRSGLRPDTAYAARIRQQVAARILGAVDAAEVRRAFRRRQLHVHPDRTAALAPPLRSRAERVCQILGAAQEALLG